MNVNTLEKIQKNNETRLSKDKREYLIYENDLLVPCTLKQEDDEFILNFNVAGMELFKESEKKSLVEKYRLLANCADLERLRGEYYFSLEPENLLYDLNLCPKVIMRDAPVEEDDFMGEYKALIGAVLYPRYKFADYYSGGKDLYKKKSVLRQIKQFKTVREITDFFLAEHSKELEILKNGKLLVNKKNAIASRIAIPVLAVSFIALCIKGYFVMFIDLPYRDSLIKANNAYIAEDYLGTQKSLKTIEVGKLSVSSKYTLARAYVITESLTSEQKENVLTGITLKSDERVLDYWIELGRLNFDGAVDYAKRLGDDELLLFALIKQSTSIKNDTMITGEKKAEITKKLEDQIKTLNEKMGKQQEALTPNNAADVSVTSVT